MDIQKAYRTMFRDYPDVVNVEDLCKMLGGISIKSAYRLLRSGEIKSVIIGKRYRIPKIFVTEYINALQKSCS